MSQEVLAETAKVSLRTIQRIERNANEPRGQTLQLICEALQLNIEDILDYGKQEDKSYLMYLHISVISFLVMPLGNILLPLILWLTKKDKVIGLNELGKNILNFQIIWTFITYGSFLLFATVKIMHLNLLGILTFETIAIFWILLNAINIILPILFAIKTSKNHSKMFYPKILKIIK